MLQQLRMKVACVLSNLVQYSMQSTCETPDNYYSNQCICTSDMIQHAHSLG